MGTKTAIPPPFTVEIGGHAVAVSYDYYYSLKAIIRLPPAVLRFLDELDALELDPGVASYSRKYIVVDENGNRIVDNHLLSSLVREYESHLLWEKREQNEETFRAQLDELEAEASDLMRRGLSTSELMDTIVECQVGVSSWPLEDVVSKIQRIRRLIGELNGPFTEVVVRGLLKGTIYHKDSWRTNKVRTELTILWVRSGGSEFIELPTDDDLAEIYQKRLQGLTTMEEVLRTDLGIKLDDYAPDWLLEELDLAPESIAVTGVEGEHHYDVVYSLRPDGNMQVPSGTIQMRLNVYNRVDVLPELPHGIQLFVELTVQGSVVVKGWVADLPAEIKKRKGAKNRAANAPANVGIHRVGLHGPVAATGNSPWYVGHVRWR